MTPFDLLFLVCALVVIGSIGRILYLLARKRTGAACRVFRRVLVGAATYFGALLIVSFAAAGRIIPPGAPHCFDDFCVTIDGAVQTPMPGAGSSNEIIVVNGRVSSTARRRQREIGIRGVLLDQRGERHEVSPNAQRVLAGRGEAGSPLDAFVDPYGTNRFALAFELPPDACAVSFVVAHGRFPEALIINGDESLLHRPTAVPLGVSCRVADPPKK